MRLTKRVIDAARPPTTGVRFLRDEGLKGFGLKLTSKGTRTFFIEKDIHGHSRRLTIGRYGQLTLDEARKLALKKFVDIAEGKDPVEERRARRKAMTWADLEPLYLQRHAIHNKSIANDERNLRTHLAFLRPRRLTTITSADLSTLHAEMGAAGHRTGANAVLALARSMFNRAIEWGLLTGVNPASGVKKFKLQSRERFVTGEELPRLWAAMTQEPNPYVRGAFFIGLLTGARRNEVLGMKWSDLGHDVWTIPTTKAKRPHVLPLPRLAIEELRRLPRVEGNPHVFPGRWGKHHLVNVAKPWRRIRKEAGIEDVWMHDLRRTLGSWLVAQGASLPLIGKTLNHSQPSTTQVYARLQIEPVRLALEANATAMLAVVEKGPHAD